MKLRSFICSVLVFMTMALNSMSEANAAVTAFFSAGSSCGGAASAAFSTGGAAVTVSLCVTTTTEPLCANSLFLQSANAGENGRFNVTGRTNSTAYASGQTTNIGASPNLPINNPSTLPDLGGTVNPVVPVPAGSNQLLATFLLSPQSTATNNSYVISTNASTSVEVDTDGTCANTVTTAIPASFTLTLQAAPGAIMGSAAAMATSGTAITTVNYTASGSPAPTFDLVTAGTLPPGLSLSSAGALTGTPTTPGTYNFTVRASNGIGVPTTLAQTVTVSAATQTITFNNPGAQPFSASPLTISATSSSGLAVTFSNGSAMVCTVSGTTVTFVTAGMCTINANAAAGTNMGTTYAAATQVQQTFSITAGVPQPPTGVSGSAGFQSATISFTAPSNTGGSAITGYTATCTGAMPATASQMGAASPLTISGLTNGNTYSCSVVATNAQGNSAASATVMVTPVNIAPPAFTSSNMVPAMTVATAMPTFNITTSGGPTPNITQAGTLPTGVVFTSAMNSGVGTLTGTPTTAGTFPITLTATNSQGSVMQSITLTVNKANQTITFPAQATASRTFSTTPFAIAPVATTTSPLAITYTSATPTICSVSGTNITAITVGTCTINANQAGDTNYNAATQQQQSVMITQATQTITFGAQTSPRGFSASAIPLNPVASASSGLAVTYTSATAGVCSVSGASFTPITLGTCTINANQAGNANFSAATQVQQSVQITQGTQTINFGNPGSVQLTTVTNLVATATSGLPVTIASTTPTVCTTTGTNGSILTALTLGACSLTLTQAGNTNFAAATPVTASITVVPLGGIIVTPNANPIAYLQPVNLTLRVNGINPTGTVTVAVSASPDVVVCRNVPLIGATASCTVPGSFQNAGVVTYSISYSGDGTNSPSSALHQQVVNINEATLSAVVSPLQVVAGQSATIRAMVVGKSLTNTVSFFENSVALQGCSNLPIALLPGTTEMGVAVCTVPNVGAGAHTYVVNYPSSIGFKQVNLSITASPSTAPIDYTDMWWAGTSENGWGVSITQHGLKQFIVLYVYDSSGKPIFYAMPDGTWNAQQTAFTGALYQPTSSPFSAYNAASFRPGGAVNGSVGTATVTYTGPSTARLDYTINNTTGTKQISRMAFGTDDGQPKLQVNDLWWGGESENGWGLNISQQGRVLFPVWYTYNAQGNATWFGVPGGTWNGNVFTGDIYSATSSNWLGVQYVAGSFAVTKVGTMSLTFSDQSSALMTYTVNGVTQSKSIVRQPY